MQHMTDKYDSRNVWCIFSNTADLGLKPTTPPTTWNRNLGIILLFLNLCLFLCRHADRHNYITTNFRVTGNFRLYGWLAIHILYLWYLLFVLCLCRCWICCIYIYIYIDYQYRYFKRIKFRGSLHPWNFDTFAGIKFRGRTILIYFANFAYGIDKAVLETGGWNKKIKNQLRNDNDFYVWISQCLHFVSNKDCINLFKIFFCGLVLFFKFFRDDLISRMAKSQIFAGT